MQITTEDELVSGSTRNWSRRALIGGAAALGTALMIPAGAQAAAHGEWRLAFRNVHTNERIDALFARAGRFLPAGLAEINHGLRDWRTGESHVIDQRLLGLLVRLRDTLGVAPARPIDLISGYRSPKTNKTLKAAGGSHSGVASKSQHLLGRATDIAVPGVKLDTLRSAATALKGGGVGYYPRDGFVHVDVAGVRHW